MVKHLFKVDYNESKICITISSATNKIIITDDITKEIIEEKMK